MATFPSITPTYGLQKSSAPNVRKVQFGDGYEARLTYGLSQNPKVFNLTFEVSETDADTIETFLDARAADNAFERSCRIYYRYPYLPVLHGYPYLPV